MRASDPVLMCASCYRVELSLLPVLANICSSGCNCLVNPVPSPSSHANWQVLQHSPV